MPVKDCPAKLKIKCDDCPYSKEKICDYPFIFNVKVEVKADGN